MSTGLPSGPAWTIAVPGLVLAFIGCVIAIVARRYTEAPRRTLVLIAVAVGGLATGWIRHRMATVMPDRRWGSIAITAEGETLLHVAPDSDAGRPRLRLESVPLNDLEFRLVGELDVRVPERNVDGWPLADRRGRWWTLRGTVAVTSDTIRVRGGERPGRVWSLPTPFTRLSALEVVRGTGPIRFSVLRPPNNVASFARPGPRQAPRRLIGHISGDPIVYDFKTVLPVTPQFIEWPHGGTWLRVEGGLVHVTVRPELHDYERLASSSAYGRLVEIVGVLQQPGGALNPAGFDPRRHLQMSGVHALMWIDARGREAPIRLLPAGGEAHAPYRSPWVAFSLDLRDRLTRVIKETLPFPMSAFVGAVTLGLRYGLQNVPCLLQNPGPMGGCPEFIADEFRAAGISHVLAVSGLHVTILTVMFVGLFSAIRLPRQVYTPLILAALVVFAIVTGARPSTLRAVIMNGLMLLSWAYLRADLRASVLLGAPVAAALILAHNPFVLTDPSFTLSFGAILSLGLLTPPVLDWLEPLRGLRLAAVLAWTVPTAVLAVARWPLVTTPQFWIPTLVVAVGLWHLAARMEERGVHGPAWLALSRLPTPLRTFLAAQGAIQIGMMIPLSAYYFARWPLAGVWANLIAIPLIGVIVQLGAIGGLLGLVPGWGPWLSLVLGAANWLASTLFLLLGHVAALIGPYPFVRRPDGLSLAAWYGLCALLAWRQPIRAWCERHGGALRVPPAWGGRLLGGVAVLLALWMAVSLRYRPPASPRLTFLAVGYGGATLVETPGGRRVLIDAAPADFDRPWRNQAVRAVLPFLSSRRIRRLDAVVLTSPRPERAAGAAWLLEHLWVRELWRPPALADLDHVSSPEVLAAKFGLPLDSALAALMHATLIGGPSAHSSRPSIARHLERRSMGWLNRWAGWTVRRRTAQIGDVILREPTPAGEFRIEVLHAGPASASTPDAAALVLRVVHGDSAVVLTSDLSLRELHTVLLTAGHHAKADLITAPHHGAPPVGATDRARAERELRAGLGSVLKQTGAQAVIAEFGRPAGVPGASPRQRELLAELTRQIVVEQLGAEAWFCTDTGAIIAESDGRRWTIRSALGSTASDEETDWSWGL